MLELSAYIGFAELCQGVVKTGLCIAIPEVEWKALKAAKTLLELLKQTILINRLDVLQSLSEWARACKSYCWDLPGHIRTSGSSLWFGSQEDAAQTQLTPVRIYQSNSRHVQGACNSCLFGFWISGSTLEQGLWTTTTEGRQVFSKSRIHDKAKKSKGHDLHRFACRSGLSFSITEQRTEWCMSWQSILIFSQVFLKQW